MTIKVGDKIPACTLKTMDADGPKDLTTEEIFAGKKVVLFAVPGAFTPGCSRSHLPGFIAHHNEIVGKGVDRVACLSVNDAFVMGAWGEAQNAGEILMLADGNAEFTDAVGLALDGFGFGMGKRSQRYSMIVEDGTVTALNVESGPGIEASSAETMLTQL